MVEKLGFMLPQVLCSSYFPHHKVYITGRKLPVPSLWSSGQLAPLGKRPPQLYLRHPTSTEQLLSDLLDIDKWQATLRDPNTARLLEAKWQQFVLAIMLASRKAHTLCLHLGFMWPVAVAAAHAGAMHLSVMWPVWVHSMQSSFNQLQTISALASKGVVPRQVTERMELIMNQLSDVAKHASGLAGLRRLRETSLITTSVYLKKVDRYDTLVT